MAATATNPKSKTDLIKEYLEKNPGMAAIDLAKLITEQEKVEVTNRLVTKVKAKLKADAKGGAKKSTKPKTKPAASKPAASKPAASKPAASKPAASKPAANAASAAPAARKTSDAVSQHIANIKAAVAKLGKEEARRILDLF